MPTAHNSAARSGCLTIDATGRLLALMPSTGHHHHVTGTRDNGPNTPYLLCCTRQPTAPGREAQDRTRRSRRADGLLLALLALLVVAGFARCTAARPASAAHSTAGETATPTRLTAIK